MDQYLYNDIYDGGGGFFDEFLKKAKEIERQKHLALFLSIHIGQMQIFEKLMTLSIDLTYEEEEMGGSALNMAASFNRLEMAQILIEKGSDVNYQSSKKVTPLMMAACNKNPDMVDLLIQHGALVDLREHNGKTALMCAANYGCIQSVEHLIQAGADVFVKDNRGLDAHHFAMTNGHFEIAKLIQEQVRKKIKNTSLSQAQKSINTRQRS